MNKGATLSILSVGVAAAYVGSAFAQGNGTPGPGGANITPIENVLGMYFVLAVVIEVALNVVFQWRPFVVHFHGKGVKTPVAVIVSGAIVYGYGLDIIRDLLLVMGLDNVDKFGGGLVTALLLAGGSSSINTIFIALKLRDPKAMDEKAAQARQQGGDGTDGVGATPNPSQVPPPQY